MKNRLLKLSFVAMAAFVFIGGAFFVKAQTDTGTQDPVVYNQSSQDQDFRQIMDRGWGTDSYGRSMMGRDAGYSLERFAPRFMAAGIGAMIVIAILAIACLVFWIMMLVHAIKHDIEYKPVWILVLWFMTIVGAIVYYFAVKKERDKWGSDCYCSEGGICNCEDGKCNCTPVEEIVEEVKVEEKKGLK